MILKRIVLFLFSFISFALSEVTNGIFIKDHNSCIKIDIKKIVRNTDSGEEYGKSCDEYLFIDLENRLKILKNQFTSNDFLSDAFIVPKKNSMSRNVINCTAEGPDISTSTYKESIEYISDNLLSIKVFSWSYGAGAAHGNENTSHYTYGRKSGKRLVWSDLFGKNKKFDNYLLKRVKKEIANEDFLEMPETQNALKNFSHTGYFAIIDAGLLIQYGKYDIAPGSDGSPSLIVAKNILKKFMDKDTYKFCFSNRNNVEQVVFCK